MTDHVHMLRNAASSARVNAECWSGSALAAELREQERDLDAAADHLERLRLAAEAVVKHTTQALGGDWIITGDGEKLIGTLQEALGQ
jgi:hypothetical protein